MVTLCVRRDQKACSERSVPWVGRAPTDATSAGAADSADASADAAADADADSDGGGDGDDDGATVADDAEVLRPSLPKSSTLPTRRRRRRRRRPVTSRRPAGTSREVPSTWTDPPPLPAEIRRPTTTPDTRGSKADMSDVLQRHLTTIGQS